MLTRQALEEVVTLPEAAALAKRLGYSLDRSNLLRYAKSGRLIARKSQGTWLTTRSAVKALIVELSLQPRGRPSTTEPAWVDVEPSVDLVTTLAEIDELKAQLATRERSSAENEQLRRELTVEAIYHTNRIEGNELTLPEVRSIVEAMWAENQGRNDQPES
jgi:hypothetical protein